MIDDGGPAFPCMHQHDFKGMSLRDYLAIHASETAMQFYRAKLLKESGGRSAPLEEECRYAYADAMIAERKVSR